MKKIIVISGKQYSGKDTLAKMILKDLKDFRRVGIGDAIKIEYGKMNGLSFEEIEKNKHLYRNDLIELGNKGRAIDPNYWLKSIVALEYNVIVPDVRVVFEAELFRKAGAYLIRVNSSFENRSSRAIITNSNDKTEVALDDYPYFNKIIENNEGIEELEQKEKLLLPEIKAFFA